METMDIWGDLHEEGEPGNSDSIAESITLFLSTHQVPIFVVNFFNGLFGHGVDIPAAASKVSMNLRESLEDLTSTQ